MTTAFPFIRPARLGLPLAIGPSGPVSFEKFLGDVAALAHLLPRHRHIVNLCSDRYRFSVALAAALLREQVTVLPPGDSPAVLGGVVAEFDDLYALHDDAAPTLAIPAMAYPRASEHGSPAAVPLIAADQPAIILFTSGSTGRPTPHRKNWGSLAGSALAAGSALGVGDMPGAAVIGTVPQQHSYGFESTVMLPLLHGLTLHHSRPFYPSDIAVSIERAPRPRILVTTPIHLRAIVVDPGQLPPVDLVVSATAPLSVSLAAEAERRFAAPLLEIYGCSEAGQLATRRTVAGDEWQCMEGVALRQNAAGTWASGASIGGEVLLGDVIELRAPDRFCLRGRTADLVNIAGKRASLAHLNHHLHSIDGVQDGVFLMPEEGDGPATRLMAVVVAPELTADAIMAALRERIDPAFLPRPLRLVDALPRNALGKLTRDAVMRLVDRNARRSS
ncbi:MAG TPA: AMP-binding protein [Stellaceae bacterium]|jgi:acyl-coenzyme A synthetase/AMP-(fatty) acid ligase